MYTTIQNKHSPASTANGRYFQTFTPKSPDELIRIHHLDGCIGTTRITELQLEQGTAVTDFVYPKETQTPLAGLFNDLRLLNIKLTDPNSPFWSQIKATNTAMLTEFYNGKVSSAIGQSADSIIHRIEDQLKGSYSSFDQRLDALKTTVKNETVTSTVTQLADTYDRKIEEVSGKVTRVTQDVNGINQSVKDLDKKTTFTMDGSSIRFGSGQVIDGKTLTSMIAVNPDNVNVITRNMKVTGNMLVDGSITGDKIKANSIGAGHIKANSIDSTMIKTGAIRASDMVVDTGFVSKLVASDLFAQLVSTNEVIAKNIKANIIQGYTGLFGGFRVGPHPSWGGNWITSVNGYSVGMSNGSRGAISDGTALFVNWGPNWKTPGGNAWYVQESGEMYCRNYSYFYGATYFYANIGTDITLGFPSSPKDLRGYTDAGKATSVVWHSQWSSSSDIRLKRNVKKADVNALNLIEKMQFKQFDWKKDGKHEELGLIAQQLQKIHPKAIVTDYDYLQIDYISMIPYLLKAIQELNEKLEELKHEQ